MVPTRTLVQIRTHAQKYFMKSGPSGSGGGDMQILDDDGEMGGGGASGGGGAGAGAQGGSRRASSAAAAEHAAAYPLTTLRHVYLEPLSPLEPLAIVFSQKACEGELEAGGGGYLVVAGFQMLPAQSDVRGSTLAPQLGLALGSAEESDLVRVGDVVLGVAGMSTAGMDVDALLRAIAAARSVTPGAVVILHLADCPIVDSEVEEASVQMAAAAAHLLAGKGPVEAAWDAIRLGLGYRSMPLIFPLKIKETMDAQLFPSSAQLAQELTALEEL